jgi:hypothetical protein
MATHDIQEYNGVKQPCSSTRHLIFTRDSLPFTLDSNAVNSFSLPFARPSDRDPRPVSIRAITVTGRNYLNMFDEAVGISIGIPVIQGTPFLLIDNGDEISSTVHLDRPVEISDITLQFRSAATWDPIELPKYWYEVQVVAQNTIEMIDAVCTSATLFRFPDGSLARVVSQQTTTITLDKELNAGSTVIIGYEPANFYFGLFFDID